MAKAVIMPKQGISVESCIITGWNKKVGDDVKTGDILFSYETDKAAFEEEATFDGVMLAILRQEDDDVPCLENVCVIGSQGDDISEFTADSTIEAEKPQQSDVKESKQPEIVTTQAAIQGDRLFISPRAKNLAESSDADLSHAKASGPNGRVIERDVVELIKNNIKTGSMQAEVMPQIKSSDAEYTDVKLSKVRKVIANSMHSSLSNMAQLTLNSSFDATAILKYRKNVKANRGKVGINNITINDIILYTTAQVLTKYPDLNAHLLDDAIRQFSDVNLGVAVDTSRGLLVPTLFKADKFSLNELSELAAATINDARGGSISPDLLTGGTFTVTNLGTLGVESFTPVINPPQTGILGVCTITQRIKVTDGEITAYPAMTLSLTFDHRAVDGAPAAVFLQDLCSALENFDLTLAL